MEQKLMLRVNESIQIANIHTYAKLTINYNKFSLVYALYNFNYIPNF